MSLASFGDDLDEGLSELQSAAEDRMRDQCVITKPGEGEPVFDRATRKYTDPAPVEVYRGKCRLPRRPGVGGMTSEAAAGDASWKVGEYPIDLPMRGSERVGVNQTATILKARDRALVGNVYGITEPADQSQATARRFRMKRVVGVGGQ